MRDPGICWRIGERVVWQGRPAVIVGGDSVPFRVMVRRLMWPAGRSVSVRLDELRAAR